MADEGVKDIDMFRDMIDRFGLKPTVEESDKHTMFTFMEGDEKVTGYTWFHTVFFFNKDGSFEDMGAWE